MRLGRKRSDRRNYRDNRYRKKRNPKTIIRLIGGVLVALGFVISFTDLKDHQLQTLSSLVLIIAGMIMILQRRLWIGFKNAVSNMNTPRCNCCKCTNCASNHNHWTHD